MKDILSIYQKCFDNLIHIYSKDDFYDEIKKAKIIFNESWGKIVENDPNYEARLHHFFDWYLFERELTHIKDIPINHFIETVDIFDEEEKEIYLSMAKSLHSIFLINKISKKHLVLSDLFDKKGYQLQSCDFKMIFEPNSIIDGRLIITRAGIVLSNGFCLHPLGTTSYIKKQVAQVRKVKAPLKEKKILLYELMKKLIRMYNLHLVYKHVDIGQVYSNNPIFSDIKNK